MIRYNRSVPDGTRDIYLAQAELRTQLARRLVASYEAAGFREAVTPALEYYDVFDFDGQPVPQERMYKLSDTGGRLLVLRPDNTTPLARLCATKLKDAPRPLKLYYNSNVYRVVEDYGGRRREYMQSGVEIVGAGGMRSDLQCVEAAINALACAGGDFKIELGHAGFYPALLDALGLPEGQRELVRSYIEAKNTASSYAEKSAGTLSREIYSFINSVTRLHGGAEVLDDARALAAGNEKALGILGYVGELLSALTDAGHGERIILDLGMTGSLGYYTGAVVRGYIEGAPAAVLSGGRYDGLASNFGRGECATGFAVNVDMICDALERRGAAAEERKPAVLVWYDPADYGKVTEYIRSHPEQQLELSCADSYEDALACARAGGYRGLAVYRDGGLEYVEGITGVQL